MKKLLITLAAAAAATLAMPHTARAAEFREHRGVYISPYVSDWPSGPINAQNAETYKRILRNNLDQYRNGGVNVVYFAVRPLCDAAYKSAYEPWSSTVSGRRGVAPPFDPLEFLIEEAHARGIEVYTWLNAYRYCTRYKHGESPLDYELTHPEWLLVQDHETILNPALEEVKQRVCDVAADIVDHYDIDGLLFDDYYYSNPTPMEVDKEFYDAAKAADSTIGTQLEWRVSNVNDMIRRVHDTVKSHKDWVVFGTKPAGVASPPHVTSEYGLDPSPNIREHDWQYEAVAADPLYWYKHHLTDFMAPQIYWCDLFDPLQDWWVIASRKFNRHLYSAVSMSKYSEFGAAEFSREVEYARAGQPDNVNGMGFFRMQFYSGSALKYEGKTIYFPEYMGKTAFATRALTPIRPWNNVLSPATVTNLRREGNTLRWDEVEGMRYTVYAFADGEERKPYSSNLLQCRYTNSYDIPADLTGRTFGVAVYDRYGNEYSMSIEGEAAAEPVKAVLTYPDDNALAADLFDFTWEENGQSNVLEVATDAGFTDCVVNVPVSGNSISSYIIFDMQEGMKYYWRVRTSAVNAPVAYSETRSFTASRVAVTAPTGKDESDAPAVAWTPAYAGSSYLLEIAKDRTFNQKVYSAECSEPTHQIPSGKLMTGFRYYCRVTAMRDGRSSVSDPVEFWTADRVPSVPVFVNPTADGQVIHANECIEVEPIDGVSSIRLQISANAEFSGRLYNLTMRDGEFESKPLSEIRVAGKDLVSGQTYYARIRANYFTQDNLSTEKSTDYNVKSFVYDSTNGIGSVTDESAKAYVTAGGLVVMPVIGNDVEIYRADGTLVYVDRSGLASVQLPELAAGLYMIRIAGPSATTLKWVRQ